MCTEPVVLEAPSCACDMLLSHIFPGGVNIDGINVFLSKLSMYMDPKNSRCFSRQFFPFITELVVIAGLALSLSL